MRGNIRRAGSITGAEALTRKSEQLERRLQRKARPEAVPPFTLKEARALSMRIRWADTAYERTVTSYSCEAVDFFGDLFPATEVTAALVEGWRQTLQAKGSRPSTINKKVAAIRVMLSDAPAAAPHQHSGTG